MTPHPALPPGAQLVNAETQNVPCPYCRRGIDAPGSMGSGISWSGFVVAGNQKSIREISRLIDQEQYVAALRDRLRQSEERCAAIARATGAAP